MVSSFSRTSRRIATLGSMALALVFGARPAHAAPLDSPAASAPSSASDTAPPDKAQSEAAPHNDGIFGPVRIGAFAGIGFPRPLSIEGMLKLDDRIGIGLEYSVLPKLSVSGVDATLSAVDVDLRVFPMRNGFFVGIAAGHQRLDVTSSIALPLALGSIAEQVSADTWFINPRIGFLWTWSWGLTLGIDAGVQIPVSTSFTNTIPSEVAISQTATDVSHLIGKDVLPTVNLLRLGLLF